MLLRKFEVDLLAIEQEMKEEVDVLKEQLELYKVNLQVLTSAKGSSQTVIEHTVTESSTMSKT